MADVASDSVGHGAAEAAVAFSPGDVILDNILDHAYWKVPVLYQLFGTKAQLPHIELFGIDLTPTKAVMMMWIAAAIVIVMAYFGTRRLSEPVPRGFRSFLEVFVVFVRDEIARKSIGKGADAYVPYLLTTFFFILVCNLLGLVPGMKAATGIIGVTAALAIIAFIVTQIAGIRNYGVVGHYKNLVPHGMPWWLLPIMIPVEVLGMLTKPFALCIRLFANMTAGTVIIVSLISMIFIFGSAWVSLGAVPFTLFIFVLKTLVGFIQAFIFTLLTALFIGMAAHPAH